MKEQDPDAQGLVKRTKAPVDMVKRGAVVVPIYIAPFIGAGIVESVILGPHPHQTAGTFGVYLAGNVIAYAIGSTAAKRVDRAMKARQTATPSLLE